jgi:hypothetical protein
MAGPCDPFVFPDPRAAPDFKSWVAPVSSLAKKIRDIGTDDSAIMMKQLYYLRGLVVREAERSGFFRCTLGAAAPDGSVFIWFPVRADLAGGVLSVHFFNRLIEMFTLFFEGKIEESGEISRNLVGNDVL